MSKHSQWLLIPVFVLPSLFLWGQSSFGDRLKRIDPIIELGAGIELNSAHGLPDNHMVTHPIQNYKTGLGLWYSFNQNWHISTSFNYQIMRIRQQLFFDGFISLDNTIQLTHHNHALTVSLMFYRNLFMDSRSKLILGVGIEPWLFLNSSAMSNLEYVKIGPDSLYNSYLTAYPDSDVNLSLNVSLIYEFQIKKSALGFRSDLLLTSSQSIPYRYEVPGEFIYNNYYSVGGIYLRNSIYVRF